MKKNLIFILIIVIVGIVGILGYKILTKEEEKTLPEIMPTALEGKKMVRQAHHPEISRRVAMIIAFRDFRDAEYFVPKEIFEKAGAVVKTVSDKLGTAIGADGGDTEVDILLSNLNVADFDAIVFIGGPGSLEHLDNEVSYKVAREAAKQNKVLGSICISPVILAKAGVLSGKRATVWSSPLDRGPVKILEENGAIYVDVNVVVDGRLITANGPGAAQEFAQKILEVLTKE
jgi:protease I